MPSFVALLTACLPQAVRDATAAIATLEDVLAGQYDEARNAWPTVVVARERYAAQLAQALTARADEPVERTIRSMPAADLYLATACCDGDPAAVAAFREAFVPPMRAVLGKVGLPATTIDETIQRVLFMTLDRKSVV